MPKVRQTAYIVARGHKRAALGRVLDLETPTAALVFCRTRLEVDDLVEGLKSRGLRVEALHGGISQPERDRVMKKLRAGTLELVVATDVAARGLDIGHLSHVVNYDVPASADAYVHRIGRTGRAGREGVAITLVEPREHWQLKNIERATKQKIDIGSVPTVADLRAKRLELTRATLRESLLAGGLDAYRVIVESLAEEFDPLDVAAAAVKLADPSATDSGSAGDEHEIPAVAAPPPPRSAGRPMKGRRRPPRPRMAATPPRSSSPPAAPPACAPETSSARSSTRPRSSRTTSAQSRSPSASPWSRSPSRSPKTSSAPSAPPDVRGKKVIVRRERER